MIDDGLDAARTSLDSQEYGEYVGGVIMRSVKAWEDAKPRTVQSQQRVLGMSDLGGCREFIRATIAGDPKDNDNRVSWPADIGTWVGDGVETAVTSHVSGASSQGRLTVTLPKTGIQVSGSTDIKFDRHTLVDLKTKDGTDTVRTEGPSLGNRVQLSGYLVAGIQAGELDEDAVGVLVYLDRSGRDVKPWTFTITAQEARGYLEAADDRLMDVAKALQTGEVATYLRDMPESWCFHTHCPFYTACWEGYQPTGALTDFEEADVALYDKGRAMKKEAENIIRDAKTRLYTDPDHKVEGVGKRFKIKWVERSDSSGYMYSTIDVREMNR